MEAQSPEDWFYSLDAKDMVRLCREWTKQNISVELPDLHDYDEWLDYFRKLPPATINQLAMVGQTFLPTEAYAALTRWADILKSPHRIDKIYQAGLAKRRTEQKSIIELAKQNDKLGMLYAIRDQLAEKLDRGTGARDTANLAREMSDVLDQITEAERRAGPKKDTVLANLMDHTPAKRTRGKGARDKSYASKLTIKDVEND